LYFCIRFFGCATVAPIIVRLTRAPVHHLYRSGVCPIPHTRSREGRAPLSANKTTTQSLLLALSRHPLDRDPIAPACQPRSQNQSHPAEVSIISLRLGGEKYVPRVFVLPLVLLISGCMYSPRHDLPFLLVSCHGEWGTLNQFVFRHSEQCVAGKISVEIMMVSILAADIVPNADLRFLPFGLCLVQFDLGDRLRFATASKQDTCNKNGSDLHD
jgi:hypothetical protein